MVTASAGSFSGLAEALSTLPAAVVEHPLITFRAPRDWAPLDHALDQLSSYQAIAVTSPRAAAALADRIAERGIRAGVGGWPPLWAGGATTAAALSSILGPARIPNQQDLARNGAAGALAIALLDAGIAGPVLFPCGNNRRDELPEGLRREGVQVDEVVCYESVLASESSARASAACATMMVVASPGVAHLLAHACASGSRPDLIAVGPTTSAAAHTAGWDPAVVAELPTVDAVAVAIRMVLAGRSSHE